MQEYRYRPLATGEIRLVQLEEATDQAVICSLCHVNFREIYKRFWGYRALSYVWGAANKPRKITCDGKLLPVTENLYHALRRLLLGKKRRKFFWIDAICIDQSNIPERNAQVQLMAQIYHQAETVIVWLGEESDTDGLTYRLLTDLATFIKIPFNLVLFGENYQKLLQNRITQFLHLWLYIWGKDKEKMFEALTSFLLRPWFGRLWVVQEVAFADRAIFHFGKYRMRFRWLYFALRVIAIYVFDRDTSLLRLNALRTVPFMHVTRSTVKRKHLYWRLAQSVDRFKASNEYKRRLLYDQQIEVLIGRTLSLKASDPRDHVFALLNLSPFKNGSSFVADYSLDAPSLYKKLAIFCLEECKSARILSLAGVEIHGSEWSSLVPSWVPDLSMTSTYGKAPQSMIDCGSFSCSPEQVLNVSFSGDKNTLVLKGMLVDVVESVVSRLAHSSPESSNFMHLAMGPWLLECESLVERCVRECLTREKIIQDVLWRTLLWNRAFSQPFWRVSPEMEKSYQAYRKLYKTSDDTDPLDEDAPKSSTKELPLLSKAQAFRTRFDEMDYGKKKTTYATRNGFFGSGPWVTQAGDVVCIILGAETPFILRPIPNSIEYRLVGETYLHGYMDVSPDRPTRIPAESVCVDPDFNVSNLEVQDIRIR